MKKKESLAEATIAVDEKKKSKKKTTKKRSTTAKKELHDEKVVANSNPKTAKTVLKTPREEIKNMQRGKDILMVVEAVSNEKGVARETIFKVIEIALATITAKRYSENDNAVLIRVAIDRNTGKYETFREYKVVEKIENKDKEILLEDAKKIDENLELDDIVEELIPSVDFGRIAAQQAKQVILREIRNAEREEFINEYRNKIGTLLYGVVKRVTRETLFIDIDNGFEVPLSREEMLPRDAFQINDKIRVVLKNVVSDKRDFQIILSRRTPEMLKELFRLEVPEIHEDVIEIKAIARDPGVRSKIAVKTNDGRIDPVGACIGIKGSRIQAVSNELNGEKIDVVLWNDDPAQLIVNAMAPAVLSSIVIDEDSHSIDISVSQDQLAAAIGRNGQNVQLASRLVGWTLNVMTEEELQQKNKEKQMAVVSTLMKNLDVDEDFALLLVGEGYGTLESIAYAPLDELTKVEGFDKDIAEELQNRAKEVLLQQVLSNNASVTTVKEPSEDLLALKGMTRTLAYILAGKNVVTKDDLAEMSVDELVEMANIDRDIASNLIMEARADWFKK